MRQHFHPAYSQYDMQDSLMAALQSTQLTIKPSVLRALSQHSAYTEVWLGL